MPSFQAQLTKKYPYIAPSWPKKWIYYKLTQYLIMRVTATNAMAPRTIKTIIMMNFHLCQKVMDSILLHLFSNYLAKSMLCYGKGYFSFMLLFSPVMRDFIGWPSACGSPCAGLLAACLPRRGLCGLCRSLSGHCIWLHFILLPF